MKYLKSFNESVEVINRIPGDKMIDWMKNHNSEVMNESDIKFIKKMCTELYQAGLFSVDETNCPVRDLSGKCGTNGIIVVVGVEEESGEIKEEAITFYKFEDDWCVVHHNRLNSRWNEGDRYWLCDSEEGLIELKKYLSK